MQVAIDPYTACALPIRILAGTEILGTATGFFWRQSGRTYLISNWHVLSGRNPRTGHCLDELNYRIPDNLGIDFWDSQLKIRFDATVRITGDSGEPAWIQHPIYGQKVDIAAVDVTALLEMIAKKHSNCECMCINLAPSTDGLAVTVGTDIFVLGFPYGIMKTANFPIWKRGSIATEFDFDIDNLPCFLIDTATREGMSGAPVVVRSFGVFSLRNGGGGMGAGVFSEFIGVYSGRHIGRMNEAHLGIVWKKSLIESMISDPTIDDFNIVDDNKDL